MTHAPSKNLERYELLDRIAVGGMAEVFRAKAFGAHGFEKTLAIKRILPELAKDPEFEERFIAEAKLAVELSHANVVQVLDFGRFAGSLFIAMEFVNGLDLAALLDHARSRGDLLSLPVAFQISMELMRGLSFAHQSGVVHRDVSPSNILLSRAGEVKIADFGIAVAVRGRALPGDEGRIMGKWRYMSPEQTLGKALDARSDIFSAAAVIYEIFSGDKLFPGAKSTEIIENIQGMPIPKLCDKRAEVPAEVDCVLAAALERNLGARTANAADVLRALTEASYKSATMATALDVAEVVESIAGEVASSSVSRAGIDQLIRAQLAQVAGAGTNRKTAVAKVKDEALAHTQLADAEAEAAVAEPTVIRRMVAGDGVTVLELESHTVAAAPVALRNKTGVNEAITGPAQVEVASPSLARPRSRRPMLWVTLAALLGVGTWATMRGLSGSDAPVALVAVDAAARSARTILAIESSPPGATIVVDGQPRSELTPAEFTVNPGVELRLELRLDGFEPHEETTRVPKGETVRLQRALRPYSAKLLVQTEPAGATVFLDEQQLGVTPYGGLELRPGRARLLRVSKEGYRDVEEHIDLVRDQTLTKTYFLKSSVRTGRVNINVDESWAEVFHQGKRIGTAPGSFELPMGRQVLKLVNPESGKKSTVSVVVGDKTETYEVALE